MKAAFVLFAALASSAIAAPTSGPSSDTKALASAPSGSSSGNTASSGSANGGRILADAAPQVNKLLQVVGPDAKDLLVELSPDVAGLLAGLGLPGVGTSVGKIVKTAGSVGDLLKDLGPVTQQLLTVLDKDLGYLLIELSPEVSGLVAGLGLPAVGTAVGGVVGTLGNNIKRGSGIVEDAAPQVKKLLQVTGPNAKELIVELSPEVAGLLSGLGLPGVGASVGSILKTASSVGDLLKDIAVPLEKTLTVVGEDGSLLLIQLAPSLGGLLAGLGLPAAGTSIGSVVATVGKNL